MNMTKIGCTILLGLGLALSSGFLAAASGARKADGPQARAVQAKEPVFKKLAEPGQKHWINENFYFTYRPSEKPKIGTVVLRVQVFDKLGKKDTSFTIHGQYGMPTMPGAHDSGLQPFQKNKKGVYLLPVTIVMPGEWEIRLTFHHGGRALFRGFLRFDV